MYTYKTLENTDRQTLYHAFLHAFSDYSVDMSLSPEEFQLMLTKKGFDPKNSIGAFYEPRQELIGFIFNGMRDWQGKFTAYDLGTGVAPSHRKQGVSRRMFEQALQILAQNNVEQYLLEVIQENTAAFELYKKQGLSVTKSYSVFQLEKSRFTPKASSHEIEYPAKIQPDQWERLKTWWDFHPSWQNSVDSIGAAEEEFAYATVRIENRVIGYGVIEKKKGDIPQIAVCREHRRKGVGTSLIAALVKNTDSVKLRAINVDDACDGMKRFFQALGFQHIVSQYEMMLKNITLK